MVGILSKIAIFALVFVNSEALQCFQCLSAEECLNPTQQTCDEVSGATILADLIVYNEVNNTVLDAPYQYECFQVNNTYGRLGQY